jgi:hypothetical protein
MPISGLVITLNREASLAERAIEAVAARREFTIGERNGRWLPVVMEARDDAHSRELHDWLQSLDGVDFVDVASVNFEVSHEN